MTKSSLHIERATSLLNEIEGGHALAPAILPRLSVFLRFLESTGNAPEHLESLSVAVLEEFSQHLDQQSISDHEIHMTLASVRMILKLAGARATDLQKLIAPRMRKRRKNQDGRYRFELEKKRCLEAVDFPDAA